MLITRILRWLLFFSCYLLTSTTIAGPFQNDARFTIPVAPNALETVSVNSGDLYTPKGKSSSQEFSFSLPKKIYGLAINTTFHFYIKGTPNQVDHNGLFRVVLVDTSTSKEYLVLETFGAQYADLVDRHVESLAQVCQETCVLPPIDKFTLRLEMIGEVTAKVDNFVFSNTSSNVDANDIRAKQNNKIIEQLNSLNLGWTAGETSVSNLSYSEKKLLVGALEDGPKELNLLGLEYYQGGIFDLSAGSSPQATNNAAGSASMVTHFDWTNRHGRNWVTSVKNQGSCGSCWAFGSTGAIEAITNVYFNQHIDLDLSEQDILSCSGAGSCKGGWPGGVMDELVKTGLSDEACFSYSGKDLPCSNKCSTPAQYIQVSGKSTFNSYGTTLTEENLKKFLIEKGPMAGIVDSLNHVMTLVGFDTDSASGKTVWIFKNSWGTGWGKQVGTGSEQQSSGYLYATVPIDDLKFSVAVENPIISVQTYDIRCVDEDGDKYCNWGISSTKPLTCPTFCKVEKDCDDSNAALGPFDSGYNCVPISTPVSNKLPVALMNSSSTTGTAPLTVYFNANNSYDPDGAITNFNWVINGTQKLGKDTSFTFYSSGTYQATLTVTDNLGGIGKVDKSITVKITLNNLDNSSDSGGCHVGNGKDFDPLFPLLLVVSIAYLYRQRVRKN